VADEKSDFAHQILMAAGDENRTDYLELFFGGAISRIAQPFKAGLAGA
jgi:hypothetical protein